MALRGVWGAGTGDGSRVQLLLHAAAIPMALAATPASGRTFCPHRASMLGMQHTVCKDTRARARTRTRTRTCTVSILPRYPSINTVVVVSGAAAAHQCVLVHHRRCAAAPVAPHLNCTLARCVSNASTVLIGTRIALSQQRCVFTPGLDLTASRRRARTRGILPQHPVCGASLRRPCANTRQARISSNGGFG